MSSELNFGNLSVSIFGESHGAGIGAVINGLPAGVELDMEKILDFMARRAPKKDGMSTRRSEKDTPEILSGFYNGKTTGTPLAAVIRNTDTRSQDYGNISMAARPDHADYTGFKRYKGANDPRGGGHFSGRLTAPLVFAGAVCAQVLERYGITSCAHILAIDGIYDDAFDELEIYPELMERIKKAEMPLINESKAVEMKARVLAASEELDSVGGIIECAVTGLPAGIGSPMFDGLENRISMAVFGIPAVKAVAFGKGFGFAEMRGSQANDPMYIDSDGKVKTDTNNNGGIYGGISSGMPVIFTAAIKPTPSIAKPQNTVDFIKNENTELVIKGRHDACIVPRAVPVVEAAANIAILSFLV
ncbi:MAG: chorismate synthase [Ruminiclostridium sp.]|nr:chorismate synthase [Ruminiclostridium sp.]